MHKQTKDPVAAEALRRIGEIYVIEARIRGRPAEERVAIRQAETKPLMMALWSWLMQRLEEISAKSSLASAIRYTLGHWEGVGRISHRRPRRGRQQHRRALHSSDPSWTKERAFRRVAYRG